MGITPKGESHQFGISLTCREVCSAWDRKSIPNDLGTIRLHPRGCGEQANLPCRALQHDGSSPRVWGTGLGERIVAQDVRFIPAGVGNSSPVRAGFPRRPVHPRGCGEQPAFGSGLALGCGSSPRVWGTGAEYGGPIFERRFIPAGVGNRPSDRSLSRRASVHPRGCGEQGAAAKPPLTPVGSSPRVWGTACGPPDGVGNARFIPAGVGNREAPTSRGALMAVHPRGCGEQTFWKALISWIFSIVKKRTNVLAGFNPWAAVQS